MSLEGKLRDLRNNCESIASAVVSRDGVVIVADMPEDVTQETFSIMCATILGAGMTAATELSRAAPTRIILEGPDAKTVIQVVGRRALLVVVTPPGTSLDSIEAATKPLLEAVAAETG